MKNNNFKEDELIIYQNGDRFEIGRIKRVTERGAFVYYHSGDTAAMTPFDCMHKLQNAYCIPFTILGGVSKNPESREGFKKLMNQLYGCNNYIDTDISVMRTETPDESNNIHKYICYGEQPLKNGIVHVPYKKEES